MEGLPIALQIKILKKAEAVLTIPSSINGAPAAAVRASLNSPKAWHWMLRAMST
jgi:hypothetical protein